MYDSLKVDFDKTHQLAICRPKGEVDSRFARQLLNFLLALEEASDHPFNRLLDLSLTPAVVLEPAEIVAFANARQQSTNHLPNFRCAIIAPGTDSDAAAHLYATMMKGSKIDVKVCPDPPCAAEWLGIPLSVAANDAPVPQK